MTVQYQALQDGQQQLIPVDSQKKTHTILSVAVLRATGLKDAAVLAAQEQPVPLGFAAEVGTNNYAKISFPDLLDRVSQDLHHPCNSTTCSMAIIVLCVLQINSCVLLFLLGEEKYEDCYSIVFSRLFPLL